MSSLIYLRTYTVNYRNALDRLRVRMNIILFHRLSCTIETPFCRLKYTAEGDTVRQFVDFKVQAKSDSNLSEVQRHV